MSMAAVSVDVVSMVELRLDGIMVGRLVLLSLTSLTSLSLLQMVPALLQLSWRR
jgi:hypothetical protein